MGRGLGVDHMHSVISCEFLKIVASVLLGSLVEVGFASCFAVWEREL